MISIQSETFCMFGLFTSQIIHLCEVTNRFSVGKKKIQTAVHKIISTSPLYIIPRNPNSVTMQFFNWYQIFHIEKKKYFLLSKSTSVFFTQPFDRYIHHNYTDESYVMLDVVKTWFSDLWVSNGVMNLTCLNHRLSRYLTG